MACGYKDPSLKAGSAKDRETAAYTYSNESFNLRDDACISDDVSESNLKVRHAVEQDRVRNHGHLGVEVNYIEEKTPNKKCTVVDYDLVEHIDEESHQSEDDYMDLDREIENMNVNELNENTEEKVSATDEEGGGEYVSMRLEDKWEDQHTDIRQIPQMHYEQVPEDMYVNVDTLRKAQSMYTASNEPNEHLPLRRIVSDIQRPPKPQFSKKKDFDLYDYLPVPVRIPLQCHSDENNDKCSDRMDVTDNNSNGRILNNETNEYNNNLHSTDTYSEADGAPEILREDGHADNLTEDEVYDYPRNQSQPIERDTFSFNT